MRLPNEMELAALQIVLRQISIRSDGHTHRPDTADAEPWLRDFLDTADACQEWTVDPDGDACAECLGEHPREAEPRCTIAEAADTKGSPAPGEVPWGGSGLYSVWRGDQGRPGAGSAPCPAAGPAPSWCPLRNGVTLLVRRA